MSRDISIDLDPAQIRAIEADPPTRKEVLRAGYQMAKLAATSMAPPRRTGRMANSIRGAVSAEDPNAADVSWSNKYYYGIFHEDGFLGRPGRHFLRRAYETYAHH